MAPESVTTGLWPFLFSGPRFRPWAFVFCEQGLHVLHYLGIFAIKVGGLVEVFLEVIQLAGRSVLLDLSVGYIAVFTLGESDGGRPPEGMLSAPGGGESATATGSNIHPPALADSEVRRLPGG